jgi:hypothetical protein
MSNVKVMVGQTWKRVNSGLDVEIIAVDGDTVLWESIERMTSGTIFDGLIYKQFIFAPANDLEWLAVNESKWDGGRGYPFMSKDYDCDNGVNYHSVDYDGGCKTRQQWKDMRIHLGLDMNIDDIAKEDGIVGVNGFLTGENLKEMANELSENDKPIFTQGMADAGELPPVGSECEAFEVGNKWHLVEVFAHHKNTAHFYMPNEGDYGHSEGVSGNFRPIDNRTTEEKQLDHVTHLVGSMSHLPASETGKAIIEYLKGE